MRLSERELHQLAQKADLAREPADVLVGDLDLGRLLVHCVDFDLLSAP